MKFNFNLETHQKLKSKNFVKLLMEIAEILEIFRIGKIMEAEK